MAPNRLSDPTAWTRTVRKTPSLRAHTITLIDKTTSNSPRDDFDMSNEINTTEMKVADPTKSKNRSDLLFQAYAKAHHCNKNATPAATNIGGN